MTTATLKCLVWDLDNTVWDGTLMEADACRLRHGIKTVLHQLDSRGILLSVASANDEDAGLAMLRKKGLDQLFVHPQIRWVNKVSSIQVIAHELDIGLDSIGFIDDDPFELEQVRQLLPGVRIYPAADYRLLLHKPELTPEVVTTEASRRRRMYLQEARRVRAREASKTSHREFLASCNCRIGLRRARPDDLARILELTRRTTQINATGVVFTQEQLASFLSDPKHRVFVAELRDRFVDYGKIGAAVCRCKRSRWELISFQVSCRVSTRGIASVFLSWLQLEAASSGASELACRYRQRERNQRMKLLYGFSGFRQAGGIGADESVILVKQCDHSFSLPGWLRLDDQATR